MRKSVITMALLGCMALAMPMPAVAGEMMNDGMMHKDGAMQGDGMMKKDDGMMHNDDSMQHGDMK